MIFYVTNIENDPQFGDKQQVETWNGKEYFFMNCKDYPEGIIWKALKDSGTDLKQFEKKMNLSGQFIQTPYIEAHKALDKVSNNEMKEIMTKDIAKGNWMSALLIYWDRMGQAQEQE